MNRPSHRVTRLAGNSAMIRKWLILTAGGLIGAVLSVWLLDIWVWDTFYGYAHGNGERLASLRITTVVGLMAGMLCAAEVQRLLNRSRGDRP